MVSVETIPQKDFRQHTVGIMIRQSKPRVISADPRPTKAHKVADEVRNRKCAVCGKSCRNKCEKSKRTLHVKTCFKIFHKK